MNSCIVNRDKKVVEYILARMVLHIKSSYYIRRIWGGGDAAKVNVDRIITGDGDGPLQRAPVSSCVMPGGRKIVADVDATRRDASRPADAARK